jgi:putative ABC transport system substrate-binding protein
MKRREFITLLGGATAAWPLAARAQQRVMPVIGFLDSGANRPDPPAWNAFIQGLGDFGFRENRNVTIEYRGTADLARFSELAMDLVQRRVDVIVAIATAASAAAKSATSTIPIVFQGGLDAVKLGLVASLNRPGGNVTGVASFSQELEPKRLEMLHELAPQADTVAFLFNPTVLDADDRIAEMRAAAATLRQRIIVVAASTESEIETAFASAAHAGVGAMLVAASAFFRQRREQIVGLAARYRIPANYPTRSFVDAGGLMSYGDDRSESMRQAGQYAGRILKGEKPADLPVLQPTKFEFVINLKTAKALGITFPPSFELRATEVIE